MANTGSILGGAGQGAAAGATLGPWGALAGGVIGGIGGYFSSEGEEEQYAQQLKALEEQRRIYEQNYGTAKGFLDPYAKAGLTALSQFQNFDPSVNMDAFQYDKSVQDFLDPSIAYQQEQARRQLEASASAQGGLYSGAQMKALSDRAHSLQGICSDIV